MWECKLNMLTVIDTENTNLESKQLIGRHSGFRNVPIGGGQLAQTHPSNRNSPLIEHYSDSE